MSRQTQVVHQPRVGDAPEEFLLGIPPGSGRSALFLSRHLAWDPSSFHITLSHTPKTHNYFLAFLGDGLAVVWEISTSCSFLRAGRCCLGDWRGAWLSVAAYCCRLFLSLLPSAFFFFFLMHFSSFQIWEGLTQRFHRVIALDFVGFGFSDKPVSSLGRGFLQLLLAQRLFCHASIPRKLAFAVQFLLPFTSGKGIRHCNSRKGGEGVWWRSALPPSCLYLGLT